MTTDSNTLLRDYAEHGSEEAFTELVRRYMDFVHSAALRQMGGNASLAEEVAQLVFTDLARQARRLQADSQLGGWLHRHTVFVASKLRRAESRRALREHYSLAMNEPEPQVDWGAVTPMLDEAVDSLSEPDRQAIVLRYFEQKDLRSLGASLGVSEDAAQKRVARAVERLRSFMAKRGATISAVSLTIWLGEHSVVTASASLAARVALHSLTGAAASLAGVSTFSKIIAFSKTKSALVGLALGLAAIPVWQQRELNRLRSELEARTVVTNNSATGDQDLERAAEQAELARLRAGQMELARLRGEVAKLRAEAALAANSARNATGAVPVEPTTPDESAPRTFSSTLTRRVEWGGSIVTGGWQTHPGMRTLVLVTPAPMNDGSDNVKVSSRWIHMPDSIYEKLGFSKIEGEAAIWGANLDGAGAASLFADLEKTEGVDVLGAPTISTASGRQGRVEVLDKKEVDGRPTSIGPQLDLLPTITPDRTGVDLQVTAQLSLVNSRKQP